MSPGRDRSSIRPLITVNGVRSSWDRVGHELALVIEGVLQAVQHVVEPVGQAPDLVGAPWALMR